MRPFFSVLSNHAINHCLNITQGMPMPALHKNKDKQGHSQILLHGTEMVESSETMNRKK